MTKKIYLSSYRVRPLTWQPLSPNNQNKTTSNTHHNRQAAANFLSQAELHTLRGENVVAAVALDGTQSAIC